jgi:ketosteroid isomerase-like protein
MSQEFEAFIEKRRKVASAYVNGDAKPLDEIAARQSPASFFGPMGGSVEGAREVTSRYDKDAKAFDTGSETDLEILHASADGDLGYWVGFQNAQARMKGKADPIPMRLRVTEIFRKVDGEWRLAHRHADPLVETGKPGK